MEEFLSDSLVLVGHGSTLNAESAAPTYLHASTLRQSRAFGQVLEAFWKQEPGIAGSLRGLIGVRAFVVPLFISEGYFTEEVIPRELGLKAFAQGHSSRVQSIGDRLIIYCKPVGSDASMTEVLLRRAAEVTERFPFPRAPLKRDTALFIAGHGTGNNENSRVAIDRQVDLIRSREIYGEVHSIFMEENPRISDAYQMTSLRNLVVVPYFISDGLHSFEDIPVMLGETQRVVQERYRKGQPTWRNPSEKKGRLVWYTPSIGSEPLLSEVILARVREGAAWVRPDKD